MGTSVGLLAIAGSSILGRAIHRRGEGDPFLVIPVSRGIGPALELMTGVSAQRLLLLSARHRMIVTWLVVVNTALALTSWNRTLRTLTAVESSVINGTMLGLIAVPGWLFSREQLTWRQALGLVRSAGLTDIVELRPRQHRGTAGNKA